MNDDFVDITIHSTSSDEEEEEEEDEVEEDNETSDRESGGGGEDEASKDEVQQRKLKSISVNTNKHATVKGSDNHFHMKPSKYLREVTASQLQQTQSQIE